MIASNTINMNLTTYTVNTIIKNMRMFFQKKLNDFVLQNSDLKYLGLGKNKLSSVPDFLGESFANAYLIDYSSNRLTKIPKPPSNVQLFYVMDNPIETIEAGVFEKAESLYQFFATDCQISSIENDAWQGADNLGWILLEVRSFKIIIFYSKIKNDLLNFSLFKITFILKNFITIWYKLLTKKNAIGKLSKVYRIFNVFGFNKTRSHIFNGKL